MTEPMTPDTALVRLRQYEEQPAPTWSTASYGGGAAEGALMEIARSLATEVERLCEERESLREDRERYRTAWGLARSRAVSAGSAADRYAARARDGQEALQHMLLAIIGSQLARKAAQKETAELRGELDHVRRQADAARQAGARLRARVMQLEQQLAEQRAADEDGAACTSRDEPVGKLSARSRALLAAGAAGKPSREMASLLHLSESRVYHLRGEVACALGARTWTQAVALAVAAGVISVPAGGEGL